MSEQFLEWIALYGLPLFFVILVISSAGIPFPITLMLVFVGSLVEQGELEFWHVLVLGSAGAVLGDQLGFLIGRYGGRRLLRRFTNRFGGEDKVRKAEDFIHRRGAAGIFLSRWLITPLSPWLNITSGAIDYPWRRFIFWVILGESLWVVIYVMLGPLFSDSVQEIADLMGNLTWAFFGLLIAGVLGWKWFQYLRSDREDEEVKLAGYAEQE